MSDEASAQTSIATLLGLMATLRDPVAGCAWDAAQTPASIVPFTIEEAYEIADAVERDDPDDLRDELGDLLLQVVFQARMAQEAGRFDFADVVRAIVAKLIRRHPHVFDAEGRPLDAADRVRDPRAIAASWERIKAGERAARRPARPDTGFLAGIARSLPALSRAEKLSRKAATYGFDWSDPRDVVAKVREETDEVVEAMAAGGIGALAEEVGDLLFCVATLARHLGIDPEAALRRGNAKFERRFDAMTALVAGSGGDPRRCDLATLEAAWQEVKRQETRPQPGGDDRAGSEDPVRQLE